MKKRIIWLDDQFYTRQEIFLQDFVTLFIGKAELRQCNTLSQFVEEIEESINHSAPFDGIILDNMLRREEGVNRYTSLGQPDINYSAVQAGIDIAKIIRAIHRDRYVDNSTQELNAGNQLCRAIYSLPICLLTSECEDPETQYRNQHPDLFAHIDDTDTPPFAIHSKGEAKIETILIQWIESTVKKRR